MLALRPNAEQIDHREVTRIGEVDRAIRLRQPQRHTVPMQDRCQLRIPFNTGSGQYQN